MFNKISQKKIVVFFFFILVTCIFFNCYFFLQPGGEFDPNYIYPRTILLWQKNGSLLWNPYSFCGFPQLADINRKHLFSPITLLIFLLQHLFGIPNFTSFNLIYILHFPLAGFFIYLYARSIKIGRLGAIFSGLIYAFSNFFPADSGGTHEFAARVWVGIILFFIEKALDKKINYRYVILAGVFYGIQFLSGATQEFYYFSLFLLIYFMFKYLLGLKETGDKKISSFILAGSSIFIIGFGVSAIQLFPTIELARESARFYLSNFHQAYSFHYLDAAYLKGIVLFDDAKARVFLGIPSLLLALVPLFSKKRERYYCFYLFIAVLFLVLSGKHFVTEFLYYHLPLFSFFQMHIRAFFLCVSSIAILAGIGLEKIKSRFLKILLLGIFLLQIYPFWRIGIEERHFNKVQEYDTDQRRHLNFNKTLAGLESSFLNYRVFLNQDYVYWSKYKPFLSWGCSDLVLSRFLEFSKTTIFDIDKLRAHPYYNFLLYPNYLKLTNTKYIVLNKDLEHKQGDEKLAEEIREYFGNSTLFEKIYDDDMIKGYRFKDNLPRVLFVTNALYVREKQKTLDILKNNTFSPEKTVILDEPIEGFKLSKENASLESKVYISEYLSSKVDIGLTAGSSGFLVLLDTYYPGWKAYVENKPVKIYRVDYLFRGVYIDKPGNYAVTFVYSPFSFRFGAVITIITLIACITGAVGIKIKNK